MEISDIECPFKPLMAGGDGTPNKRANVIDFDDDQDLLAFIKGEAVFEGKGKCVVGNKKWDLPQTPQRPQFEIEARPIKLDLSGISNVSSKSIDYEGLSSVLDPWDLQVEISELRFTIQKLQEQNSDLKEQVSVSQEENLQLLSQKEELERKLSHRDLAQEKIKQLQKEVEEARNNVASGEESINLLTTRAHRLERDFSDLLSKHNDLKKDQEDAMSELEKCLVKLNQKEEEIEGLKESSEAVINSFMSKEKWLEEQIEDLNQTVEDLTKTINQLRNEKFELEGNLLDFTGNQLLQLNSSMDQDDERFIISTPESKDYTRSYMRRSLQAEIAETMERKRSIHLQPHPCPQNHHRDRRVQLMDVSTQSDFSLTPEKVTRTKAKTRTREHEFNLQDMDLEDRAKSVELFNLMKDIRELIFQGSSEKENASDVEAQSGALTSTGENGTKAVVTADSVKISVGDEELSPEEELHRIKQELVEFRQQLKTSQELFHAMQTNGSASAAISLSNVTQSCPILADTGVLLTTQVQMPKNLVCCSTQTDPSTVIDQQPRRSSTSQHDGPIRSLLDAIDDEDNDGDGNYLDKLSDDISYRLTINLPTVLEESELETETSPGVIGEMPRRMSSIDKGRPKLQRSPNAMEEECQSERSHKSMNKGEEDEAFSSDNDFQSALGSLVGSVNTSANNSLERPLKFSGAYGSHRSSNGNNGNGNGDSDSLSCVSDGNTTYGSPISYPSSPTYWTPLEGSSSQETITNNDGDKTPVNEGGNGFDKYEVLSCPVSRSRTEYENGSGSLRKRGNSWGTSSLPINSKNKTSSIGVIPESDREHMIKYAYDPVTRSSEPPAALLTGEEWRTLRKDLDNKAQDKYRKRFAQEEANEVEGSSEIESGSLRLHNPTDLAEEAEEYIEKFPDLVEELFKHLDILKNSQKGPTPLDLETTSTRFNHLALCFKTEHNNLAQIKDWKLKQHDNSRSRMQDIILSLSESIEKLEDVGKTHRLPEEIVQISSSLKHIVGDLDIHSSNLSRTSRRVGMMDVQIRLYKMIEVMVLYVHILRNLYDNVEKDFQKARKLLEDSNIPFSRTNPAPILNNNNNETGSCDEAQPYESAKTRVHGTPGFLQLLFGPKKSSVGLEEFKETWLRKEKKSSTNVIIRCMSDTYETMRCELFWPWNLEETWKGTKQGFSIILMIIGLIIIFRSLFPIVSANDPPPIADLASIFSKHGDLNHPRLPPI